MARHHLRPLSCISSPPPSPRASVEVFCSQMLPHGVTLAIMAPLSSKTAKLFLRLPSRRGCYPAAIFQQSRAEVGPNSYARGDHIRPCYARQKSLKRELRATGKQTAPLEGFFPNTGDAAWFIEKTSAKDTFFPNMGDAALRRPQWPLYLNFSRMQGMPLLLYHARDCPPCFSHTRGMPP